MAAINRANHASVPLVGTSHFHRMAAYTRCLRCAGAPRRPTSGSGLSLSILSWHTVLSDPGEFDHRQFQRSDVDAAFAESRPARHSQNSRNPFHAGDDFRGFLVHTSATVCQFARPLHGSDRLPSQRGFYIRASSGLSPFPLQDITTTATGLLCWRDSHPLEWQLASLHLLLHRDGLAPSTPCRSPGALRSTPINGHHQTGPACPGGARRRQWRGG